MGSRSRNLCIPVSEPVQGGGLPTDPAFELKLAFKDGGAYDFHTGYEHVKERLRQRVEVAREAGTVTGDGSESGRGRGGGALAAVDLAAVHLDQLPAYEEAGAQGETQTATESRSEGFEPPVEPPPGYEEVQRETVEDELERRLSAGRI